MQLTTFSTEEIVRFSHMSETDLSLEIVKRFEEKSEIEDFVPQNLTTHGDIKRLQAEAESLLLILKTVKDIKNR